MLRDRGKKGEISSSMYFLCIRFCEYVLQVRVWHVREVVGVCYVECCVCVLQLCVCALR